MRANLALLFKSKVGEYRNHFGFREWGQPSLAHLEQKLCNLFVSIILFTRTNIIASNRPKCQCNFANTEKSRYTRANH